MAFIGGAPLGRTETIAEPIGADAKMRSAIQAGDAVLLAGMLGAGENPNAWTATPASRAKSASSLKLACLFGSGPCVRALLDAGAMAAQGKGSESLLAWADAEVVRELLAGVVPGHVDPELAAEARAAFEADRGQALLGRCWDPGGEPGGVEASSDILRLAIARDALAGALEPEGTWILLVDAASLGRMAAVRIYCR